MEQILAQLRSSVLPIERAWRERGRESSGDIAAIYNRAGDGYATYADGIRNSSSPSLRAAGRRAT